MIGLKVVFVLAAIALVEASPGPAEQSESNDTELTLAFIECARKAVLTGIPEIDVPSHNPLVIPRNTSQTIDLGIIRASLAIYNIIMEDIPIWEVRQLDQLDTNNEAFDVFNYTIYWPKIILKLQWQFSAELDDVISTEKEGSLSLEYDHVNFAGIVNFTRPVPGRILNINALSLDVTALDAQLNITSLGVLGELVNQVGGPAFAFLLNHNPAKDVLGDALLYKLNRDWMSKPERLATLIAKCEE